MASRLYHIVWHIVYYKATITHPFAIWAAMKGSILALCDQTGSLSRLWDDKWCQHTSIFGLSLCHFNTLRPRQNGRCFADDTFKHIFLNENVRILSKISLKFVPKGPINNNPALVQIMAWRRSGDKPLYEPMMVSLLTHICVTRPQWVKVQCCWFDSVLSGLQHCIWRQETLWTLVQLLASHLTPDYQCSPMSFIRQAG